MRAGAQPAASAPPPDAKSVQQIRDWLVHAPGDETVWTSLGIEKLLDNPASDPWLVYLRASKIEQARDRGRALNMLLSEPIPEALRRVVLIDIKSDAAYQGREAEFIRRYGFYANWFNRMAYVASRAVQGNIQAVGQLGVDAMFDFMGRGKATPAERRLYRLLERLEREGRATGRDEAKLKKLREEVDRALADADLERGRWALEQGSPGLAEFYARGALARRPDWAKAKSLEMDAAREQARRNRASVASSQVGYPDRVPPLKLSPPELARAAAADQLQPLGDAATDAEQEEIFDTSSDALYCWMLADYAGGQGDRVARLRRWAGKAGEMRGPARRYTAWVRGALRDPAFNPELRLGRAEADRRESVASFIFVGPQTARERSYQFSSRMAQAWNALSNVGVFYVFEVIYRAGLAAVKPPPPAEAAADAAAAYMRAAPEREESRTLASRLAARKVEEARFDQARALLEQFGLLDEARKRKIDKAEAEALLERAKPLGPGDPDRTAMLDRAKKLAVGGSLASAIDKETAKKPGPPEKVSFTASWESLKSWSGLPPPAGLPGRAEWFDGDNANGEIAGPTFLIESDGLGADSFWAVYSVRRGGATETLRTQGMMADQPPKTAEWIRHSLAERDRARREMESLSRATIPYEITGGAGLSGFDFYPKLLPIETKPGEAQLYSD